MTYCHIVLHIHHSILGTVESNKKKNIFVMPWLTCKIPKDH
jgi:hypothetical protein